VLAQNQPNLVKAGACTPVQLPGDQDFRTNIKECNGIPVVIGDTLPTIDASTTDIGDSVHKGFKHLIDLDPHAEWDPTTNSVINSCAQDANPCAATSPRVVALPVYNTGQYFNGIVNGQAVPPVNVVNIVGFFVDWEGQEDGEYIVEGYITEAPGLELGNSTITPESSLLSQIQLVR
jgi:hypothetical protein